MVISSPIIPRFPSQSKTSCINHKFLSKCNAFIETQPTKLSWYWPKSHPYLSYTEQGFTVYLLLVANKDTSDGFLK
ncbi:hypothetical protein GCM10007096_38290 [Pullulanibacillus pueri]|uniref:Uncharacterized protein n=1 Tax=Pullulanibacillus pueri TaxID=1437324 RepID=A0A8J3ENE1_9BACL|nr:hypothetical protein GCM10007096_38290 [Pullulanibacillus pueri]